MERKRNPYTYRPDGLVGYFPTLVGIRFIFIRGHVFGGYSGYKPSLFYSLFYLLGF